MDKTEKNFQIDAMSQSDYGLEDVLANQRSRFENQPEGNWPSRAATNGIREAVKQEIRAVPNTDAATIIGINRSNPGAICDANVVPTASAFSNPLIPRT